MSLVPEQALSDDDLLAEGRLDRRRQDITAIDPDPVFQRLEELASLKPDWDTYGGEPPTARATATAGRLVVGAWGRLGRLSLPYEVMPIADGGLQVEWRGAAKRLELNVGPEGAYSFLHVVGTSTEQSYREGDDLAWSDALALIEQVVDA